MPIKNPRGTIVPDEILDQWPHQLSGAEFKVLLYIVRRTMGFKRDRDAISLDQFMGGLVRQYDGKRLDHGCGVRDRTTVVAALTRLEKLELIRRTHTHKITGADGINYYSLWLDDEEENHETGGRKILPHVEWENPTPRGVGKSYPQLTGTNRDEQLREANASPAQPTDNHGSVESDPAHDDVRLSQEGNERFGSDRPSVKQTDNPSRTKRVRKETTTPTPKKVPPPEWAVEAAIEFHRAIQWAPVKPTLMARWSGVIAEVCADLPEDDRKAFLASYAAQKWVKSNAFKVGVPNMSDNLAGWRHAQANGTSPDAKTQPANALAAPAAPLPTPTDCPRCGQPTGTPHAKRNGCPGRGIVGEEDNDAAA